MATSDEGSGQDQAGIVTKTRKRRLVSCTSVPLPNFSDAVESGLKSRDFLETLKLFLAECAHYVINVAISERKDITQDFSSRLCQ